MNKMTTYKPCEIPKMNQLTLGLIKLFANGTEEGKLSWTRDYASPHLCYSLSLPNGGVLRFYNLPENEFHVTYETTNGFLRIYEHHSLGLGLEPVYLRQAWASILYHANRPEKAVSDTTVLQNCFDKIKEIEDLSAARLG